MQHTQANTAPVPRPRPTKPDYSSVFLEPVYDESITVSLRDAEADTGDN